MATQTPVATEPTTDAIVEQKLQKLRELYVDAPEVGKAALKNGLKMLTEELGAEGAGANRRPDRRPSGQGLGAHRVPSVRERRSEAASRPAAAAGRATSERRTRSARSTTCASCSSTTTRSCSSRRPMTATSTPTSRTSREDSECDGSVAVQFRGLSRHA
jgi:hypothetical protein